MNKALWPIILASIMDPKVGELYNSLGVGDTEGVKGSKYLVGGKVIHNSGQPLKVDNKQGRNEKCKCGSGLKYKKCCGKEEV